MDRIATHLAHARRALVRAPAFTTVGGTALLGAVVAIAVIVPARRALRIDPSEALRAG